MTSKITLFDHFLRPLDELNGVPTTPRSWLLNDYGRCEFSVSTADPKCNATLLQFGNLVHIVHIPSKDENGTIKGQLPDWTGILLPQQDWDLGTVHMTAYAAEAILAFRAMPYVSVSGTPYEVFTQILKQTNARAGNIVFQTGLVDDLPLTFPDDLRTNAYDHIKKLAKNAGMDWSVTGQINSHGSLELFANLYQRKGVVSNIDLNSTNTELASPLLSIQGTPSNQVFGYSQAATANGRYTAEAIHQESVNDYGPLQLNQVFVGMHDATSVYNAAQARAVERGRPVMKVKRIALDYKDTFSYLDTGNIMNIKDTNVGFNPNGGFGFERQVRILSIDYNDLSNKAPLNLEVI